MYCIEREAEIEKKETEKKRLLFQELKAQMELNRAVSITLSVFCDIEGNSAI